jgi:tetratricopeptide (TPR) repeat protein
VPAFVEDPQFVATALRTGLMRVAVYAIALNEVGHVARFLASSQGADLISVADTGSTDGTVAALRQGGAIVHQIAVRPWRFDDARNTSLALVPADIDVCVALDLDEVLSPGWREALEREWILDTTRGQYRFAWSHDKDGRPAVEYWYDRIHARHGYRCRHPCHECLYPDRIEERWRRIEGLRVDHWPDDGKSRGHYLPLLEAAVREDPTHPRNAHYLGREYFFRARHIDAEIELRRHLALPGATWLPENCASMRYIAKCRIALGDLDGAIEWLRRAVTIAPELRDPWVDFAEACYLRRDWPACHEAATRALAITADPMIYQNDPRSVGATPHDLASLAAWNLGHREEALAHAERAAELEPSDERLVNNVATIRALLETER